MVTVGVKDTGRWTIGWYDTEHKNRQVREQIANGGQIKWREDLYYADERSCCRPEFYNSVTCAEKIKIKAITLSSLLPPPLPMSLRHEAFHTLSFFWINTSVWTENSHPLQNRFLPSRRYLTLERSPLLSTKCTHLPKPTILKRKQFALQAPFYSIQKSELLLVYFTFIIELSHSVRQAHQHNISRFLWPLYNIVAWQYLARDWSKLVGASRR